MGFHRLCLQGGLGGGDEIIVHYVRGEGSKGAVAPHCFSIVVAPIDFLVSTH